MVEIVDLSDENDVLRPPASLPFEDASASAQSGGYATRTGRQLRQSKVVSDQATLNEADALARPPYPTVKHQPYTEAFYIDFVTTIERSFPWKSFAARYGSSEDELNHMFFVLVTLPLANPDDNAKRLKVAEGARNRFAEWRNAWEETIACPAERAELIDVGHRKRFRD